MEATAGQVVHLADYRPTDFVLERVDLTFELDPKQTLVIQRSLMHRREGASEQAPLVLDGDELTLKAVAIDGNPIDESQYSVNDKQLVIGNLPTGVTFEVTVETIIDPEANTKLMGLYRTNGTYCTQCEAEGFRRITYFMDRPDVLGVYTITIIADGSANPVMLSNGNFLGAGDYGDGRRFSAWYDPHPKPSYLFALVAGDLGVVEDTFTTMSEREVALKIYVEHGKEARAAYAMDALKRSMKWDEEAFGREYDLDIFMIVAVSDFNMGAMENKGLNVFNDKYVLADPETATDQDYANIEAIVAHEYFHNWTGNRITCRDWFQLCLKEGLTVFRDHEFSADQRSRPVKRIAEVRHLKAEQFAEDSGPLAHPVRPQLYREINNFYTTTVYEKGSEVTRMIATLLGRPMFRKGMDLYFERHDGQAVTIEDFVKCFEDVSGRDLTQFSLWYHQSGTPLVSVSANYDAASQEFKLSLEQMIPPTPGQQTKEPMHIPLAMGLILEDGSDAKAATVTGGEFTDGVLHLTERTQTFVFEGVANRPALSLNRSFSAPVNLHFDQSAEDIVHIARHDSDLFSRWQAINYLAIQELTAAVKTTEAGGDVAASPALTSILMATASDEALEPAFRAQVLALPTEADIAREIGSNIDNDAIHTTRNAIMYSIASAIAGPLEYLHAMTTNNGAFSPDAASAGRRSLRNSALTWLSHIDDGPARAAAAYAAADNMTELAHALTVLAHRFPGSNEAEAAIAEFEQRFAANPLVIDKWFMIQATVPGDTTLRRVQDLMRGSHFAPNNPNRLRSLIGSFAMSNPTGFNRADGEGYRFLAERIVEIDGRNPQVAARILTSMRSWRSLEPGRAAHAKSALLAIDLSGRLSTDVRDLIDRMLKS
ncbi:aminopeptidase N [Rhizobium sp. KVB221]|uniref:Aminopeptidase N n=1 Tax=Rhizobium setariae TaxID=2801340 RepID=A0A936YIV2_9HYPH|nr:aminopeptidase N [Rhizobium setariae]MBL0371099.1 aminopeptidase N [Rhizobium setariae]